MSYHLWLFAASMTDKYEDLLAVETNPKTREFLQDQLDHYRQRLAKAEANTTKSFPNPSNNDV